MNAIEVSNNLPNKFLVEKSAYTRFVEISQKYEFDRVATLNWLIKI
jgi:hypothetical protein